MPLNLLFMTLALQADNYPRSPNIDIQHYKFEVFLTDESDEIRSRAHITICFRNSDTSTFSVDLIGQDKDSINGMSVTRVLEQGQNLRFRHENNRIKIQLDRIPEVNDERTYSIEYQGIPADGLIKTEIQNGDHSFFADNWPDRARHWLSSVDHPYDKATCEFIVTAPSKYQVIANGRLIEETDLNLSTRRTHWLSTAPLPTKVMVIGVGRFAVQNWELASGLPIQTWVFPQDRDAGFKGFEPTGLIIDFFSDRIGSFPYAKLANVQSKTRYGGMENASCIFYSERVLQKGTVSERLITHEIAHQWFGDSVTEADWDHIWLSEGFATYFTQLFMEFHHGADQRRQGMERARQAIIRFSKSNPDSAVIGPTPQQLMRLLNTNSYQKGAWILHMLRRKVGDFDFWQGIKEYYRIFQHKTAFTKDFQAVMEKISEQDLNSFFQQWLYRPGIPFLKAKWKYNSQSRQVYIEIVQETGSDLYVLDLDLAILTSEGNTISKRVKVNQQLTQLTVPIDLKPLEVVLDPDVWLLMESEVMEDQTDSQ